MFVIPNFEKYSDTQKELLYMLGDGGHHSEAEVLKVIGDPIAKRSRARRHINALRIKMSEHSHPYTVTSEVSDRNRTYFRIVRVVSSDDR